MGELHAKLIVDSAMRVRRPGMKWDWQHGLAGLRDDAPISDPAPLVWRAPEGPEGTGGLRDRPLRAARLACGDLAGGRARRRPEHPWGHKQHKQEGRRPPAHTAAGPDSARNASGATDQAPTQHRGAGPQARAPGATTQTRMLRSTCVRSRSARAARRSRRSSRSPRLRRRAGPRR